MRTTLDVDEKLLEAVLALTKEKRKGKAVNKALEEFVRRKRIEELRAMAGTLDMVDNWHQLRHMDPR